MKVVSVHTVWCGGGGGGRGGGREGAVAARRERKQRQRSTRRAANREGSMAELQDFQPGSHCHRKTWINILLGILQLLLPCVQHGGAQLQGGCSPFVPISGTNVSASRLKMGEKRKEKKKNVNLAQLT